MNNQLAAPQVRFGDWISEGWKMFTEQWKGWVTVSLGFFLAVVVPIGGFIVVMYVMMFATMTAQGPRGAPPDVPVTTILFLYLGMFALLIVLMPLSVFLKVLLWNSPNCSRHYTTPIRCHRDHTVQRELPKTTLKREAERDAAEKTGWQRKENQWVVAWRSDKS